MTFPNLLVTDLPRSTEFYKALGFEQNMMFSDENASSIVLNENTVIMLLRTEFFSTFLPEGSAAGIDPQKTSALLALLLGSEEEVDEFQAKAEATGGNILKPAEPNPYEASMYGGQLADPDGHIIEFMYMPSPE